MWAVPTKASVYIHTQVLPCYNSLRLLRNRKIQNGMPGTMALHALILQTRYRNYCKCHEQSGNAANKKTIHQLLILVSKKHPSEAYVGAWCYSYTLVLDEDDKSAPSSNQFPPGGRRLGGPLGWLKHNNDGKNT
jgi:hypothetical protein